MCKAELGGRSSVYKLGEAELELERLGEIPRLRTEPRGRLVHIGMG
jgi:hypothetical protein